MVQHADMSESEMVRTVEWFAAACGASTSGGSSAAEQQQQQQQQQQGGGAAGRVAAPSSPPRRRRLGGGADSDDEAAAPPPPPRIEVLACTDACLRALPKEVLPLAPTLLVSGPASRKRAHAGAL